MSDIVATTPCKTQSSGTFRTRTAPIPLEKDQNVLFGNVPAIKQETCYTEVTGDCTNTSGEKDTELYTVTNPVRSSVRETKYRSRSKQKPLIRYQRQENNKEVIEDIDTIIDCKTRKWREPLAIDAVLSPSSANKRQNYNRYRCASGNRIEIRSQDPIYTSQGPLNLLSTKRETHEKRI
ncbi:unnamed protein product, partial [Rotaria sp. Silwood1]